MPLRKPSSPEEMILESIGMDALRGREIREKVNFRGSYGTFYALLEQLIAAKKIKRELVGKEYHYARMPRITETE